jgi:hypothetical protein
VWLVSSTPDNTPFYNAQGYVTLSNIILGDDDPARAANPVILPLVSLALYEFELDLMVIVDGATHAACK